MKACGEMIWLMDKESLFTQTEIFMRVNGLMIKHMERELIHMPTGQSM